jgi:class 3 adenylate cyclase/tetratricopeptide (TPR) repeat protein
MSGSTALGEAVDAESVQELLLDYFQEMRAAVERHGGVVEKFIGDAVVAAFGVPESHEDDALRACRAALEMQARIATLNDQLIPRFGTSIAVRIGVNTGEIVMGGPMALETLVTGDAVNVGARLEQAAAPGEVLLGESTYRLVKGAVEAEVCEAVIAKGKSQPVPAYRLLEVSDYGMAPRRSGTPFAGRAGELQLLAQELADVAARRICRMVTIVGEPGVGKSRLTEEFVRRLATEARVVRGTCLSYGEGITYWAVSQIVRDLAGITTDQTLVQAMALIEARVQGVANGSDVAAKIGQLLGLTEGTTTVSETVWAVRSFITAGAGNSPTLVVVDDIHWADMTLLDLIAELAEAIQDSPVMLVCLARPELLERRPSWRVNISLEPLDATSVDALLEGLLGAAPPAVRARLAAVSAGNPLHLEELVTMLEAEGVLRLDNGVCTLEGSLDAVSLPTSLQALLGARLDQLEPDVRVTLQCGAIEGEVFHLGAVKELSEPALRPSVTASLANLVDRDVVRATVAQIADEPAFRFKHMLFREAAYQATPKKTRAARHERFAGWLERRAGERASEYQEILGYHLEQSYRLRAQLGPIDDEIRGLGDRAGNRLGSAARGARARGDFRAASNLFARAADLASVAFERATYSLGHGEAELESGFFATAEALLAGVRSEAFEAGWRELEAAADVQIAMLKMHTSPMEVASNVPQVANRALETFEALRDDRGTAIALMLLGQERWLSLCLSDAEHLLDRALDAAERAGDMALIAEILRGLARAAVLGPRHVETAVSRCEAYVERARSISPMAAARISAVLGVLEALRGNSSKARVLGEEARAVMRQFSRLAFAGTGMWTGLAALIAGDAERAEHELRSSSDVLEELGDLDVASTVAAMRARALVDLERWDEADGVARTGLNWADPGDVATQAMGRGALARSLAARGRTEEAVGEATRAVQLLSRSDAINLRGDSCYNLALVLQAVGDHLRAREAAEEALSHYNAKGNVFASRRASRLLGH